MSSSGDAPGAGGLDIRLPLGFLFTLLGLVLVGFGLLSDAAIYRRALGINLNLWWGAVMASFGMTVLALAARARSKARASSRKHARTAGNDK